MEIPNLLLNVNYKDTSGQSSILQHLLTYSDNVGIFPQHLNEIAEQRCFLYRNKELMISNADQNAERVVGIVNLLPNYTDTINHENYLELLKELLSDCTDIENEPILNSDFKFCLPGSVEIGNLATKHPNQCMYFTKQPRPLYIYDHNVRYNPDNTTIINEDNLGKLTFRYNLDEDTYTSFDMFLSKMGREISYRKPSQAANFIKDKPIALCNMALERGLDYTIEEGVNLFTKEFLSVGNIDDFSEISNVTLFEINELTANFSTGTEYYKYVCDSLKISQNLELFEEFHDIFVKADTKDRLKIITRSDFLTNILCNETNKN